MKQMIFNRTLLLLITVFGLIFIQDLNAQDWDYKAYPHLPYEINHLDAEINLSETGSVEGDLLYMIRFKDSGVDSLVFQARDMEVISIFVNDDKSEFYLENDHLVIFPDRDINRNDDISLRLQYRTQPEFGYFQTAKGTFFTSSLPKTTSHWLPVVDHPRVQFTTELIFTHPAGKKVISTGRRSTSEVTGVSEEKTTYSSGKPVSPVNLNFVLGNLERVASTESGVTSVNGASLFEHRSDNQIHIYSEISDLDGAELLEKAVVSYATLYNHFGIGYPWKDLSIVVLEDDFWETKSYAAGTIYLFDNRGDLVNQLRHALIGQWMGTHIREEQWSDAEAILALQAWTSIQLFDMEYQLNESEPPYHIFSGKPFSRWQNYLLENPDSKFSIHLKRVYERFITEQSRILSWDGLAEHIYNVTGHPHFDGLDLGEVEIEEEKYFPYRVEMTWNEDRRNITMNFNALDQSVNELVTVHVDETTLLGDKEHEITFTGSSDSIVLNASANTENIKLTVTSRDDIELEVEKPFEFWIYQLSHEEDPESRKEAAEALANFADNPDLQLALQDRMRNENDSSVYASLLRSLSSVTRGASGTDQIHLDHLSDNYTEEVQLAAVEGMAYFEGNDRLISRLRSIAGEDANEEIRKAAIRSLFEITEVQQFRNISEELITNERNLKEVPMILNLLARKGAEEAAVQFSSTFLAEGFPFTVRSKILEFLLETDQSREGWENRLPALMSDRDPRIRVMALDGLDRIGSSMRESLVESRWVEESDERVRRALLDD